MVKSLVSMGNESRSISQAVGEKIAKAVENQHFDKKALGYAKSLYQMSINRPQSFAITFIHLLAYINDLGLDKAANDARGMDIDGEDDGEESETAEHDETPAAGKSPGLSVVRGSAAPQPDASSEVPPAPSEKDERAA